MTRPAGASEPKSSIITQIVAALFVIGLFTAAGTACVSDQIERKEAVENAEPARFEVVESFRMFDKNHPANADNGFIIRDRKHPDRCFLQYRYGSGNGGVGLTPVPCDDAEGKDGA